MLGAALPRISDAAGVDIGSVVSTRHDPMDAIEELVHDEPVDELIIATAPHRVESWLHVDLAHRAAHLGLPVTSVVNGDGVPARHVRAFATGRKLLNKVPEVTLYFWIIKILCTTVGETLRTISMTTSASG